MRRAAGEKVVVGEKMASREGSGDVAPWKGDGSARGARRGEGPSPLWGGQRLRGSAREGREGPCGAPAVPGGAEGGGAGDQAAGRPVGAGTLIYLS